MMLTFINTLKERYLRVLDKLNESGEEKPDWLENLVSLSLAEAALDKLKLTKTYSDLPLQLAILGPTQAGKSTVLNIIVKGGELAGVSPLAGYTVHAQGFTSGISTDDLDWLKSFFKDYQQTTPGKLDSDNLQQFAISAGETTSLPSLHPYIVWDSPDFDSKQAHAYHSAVLKTLALADTLILVVSKEKYADHSLWEMLQLVVPLQKPLVVCLNKLDKGSEQTIVDSFLQRYKQQFVEFPAPTVISIPFYKGLDNQGSQLPVQINTDIQQAIIKQSNSKNASLSELATWQFIESHWINWTKPLEAERQALEKWEKLIDATLAGATDQYRRDYLNHPQHYDTFNRTLAELLTLLEIPGVAVPLSKARKVITWPARKLLTMGREYFGMQANHTSNDDPERSPELSILKLVCDYSLTTLQGQIQTQGENSTDTENWWNDLAETLNTNKHDIIDSFQQHTLIYQSDFQKTIEDSAQGLYENLQQQPLTLNSLRAARVTADAAGLALALKTGGVGINDLILAPAMLTITNMLTESAIGRYIAKAKARLQIQQFDAVSQLLYQDQLKPQLLALSKKLNKDKHFMISNKVLSEAQQELTKTRAK